MAAMTGRALDLWAVALGAGNDGDALRALSKLIVLTITARQTCDSLADATADLPNCPVHGYVVTAGEQLQHIEEEMLKAVGGFRAHARGRG